MKYGNKPTNIDIQFKVIENIGFAYVIKYSRPHQPSEYETITKDVVVMPECIIIYDREIGDTSINVISRRIDLTGIDLTYESLV